MHCIYRQARIYLQTEFPSTRAHYAILIDYVFLTNSKATLVMFSLSDLNEIHKRRCHLTVEDENFNDDLNLKFCQVFLTLFQRRVNFGINGVFKNEMKKRSKTTSHWKVKFQKWHWILLHHGFGISEYPAYIQNFKSLIPCNKVIKPSIPSLHRDYENIVSDKLSDNFCLLVNIFDVYLKPINTTKIQRYFDKNVFTVHHK